MSKKCAWCEFQMVQPQLGFLVVPEWFQKDNEINFKINSPISVALKKKFNFTIQILVSNDPTSKWSSWKLQPLVTQYTKSEIF